MPEDTDGRFLYPNRGDERTLTVSRRLFLGGSLAAGTVVTAGCSSDSGGQNPEQTMTADTTTADTVFVFNTGDRTMSLIDADTDEVVGTADIGVTASFPSNQFAPGLTDSATDSLWLNVDRGVRALEVGSLDEVASVDTDSGANWLELTPDGTQLVVSAREPAHSQFRLDADPSSDSFGTVTAKLDRTSEGGRGDNDGPGPCDVTIHPDGAYAYVPDLFGDTLSVLDIDSFEIVEQIAVPPVVGSSGKPWMGTAAPDGETLLVEHDEGGTGTESIWDTTDPASPTERVRLTSDDGLGSRPLTSEIGPDSETGYVFTPGTDDVSVIDLAAGTVTDRIDVGGSAFVGTWGPNQRKLYVPVQSSDEVAVIDHTQRAVTATLSVGPRPYGATAGTVRPSEDIHSSASPSRNLSDELAGRGTTYCIGECACGHTL